MKILNLPVIKAKMPEAKVLCMNDYIKFVAFHLRYTFDRKTRRKREKSQAVNVPFILK